MLEVIDATSSQTYGSPVDQLIYDFKQSANTSYIYVTHSMDLGSVTHHTGDKATNDDYIALYKDEVASWRKQLKISDETQILVSFVWCHDDRLHLFRMYPECLICDITFGVTKEERNLFLFAGIDGQ